MRFDDNRLLALLFGEHDCNLARIEQRLGVSVASRGNTLAISGPPDVADRAREALNALYERLRQGYPVDVNEVDAALRHAEADISHSADLSRSGGVPAPGKNDKSGALDKSRVIVTRKRRVTPRSPMQTAYISALRNDEMVFALGPAGTGKTYLAVAVAVAMLDAGEVERIILSRPAVEAGERLGFLPGDMRDKVDPYLRPLYDALYDMLPGDTVARYLSAGEIEVAPLAFMRGRTLSHAFVILDEAQNTTPVQMMMFLTRLGEGSRLAVTGDPSQVDLPSGVRSGLVDALETVAGISEIGVVRFTEKDVVRHSLVTKIVRAYESRTARQSSGGAKETISDRPPSDPGS
ncbi:MAG: PhoH family protein [Alphaproteobacteria bacterium]